MGFSTIHILKEQITSVIKYFAVICLVLLFLLNLYYALTNRYDFSYLATSVLFFIGVLAINILCVLITSILIKFVSLEAMIKNKTLNSGTNIVVQAIKIIFSVIIAITIISLLNQGNSFRQSQQAVLDYKYLDGYYTANGFNSSEYDYALANTDILEKYSEQTLEMYNHNHSLLCDFRTDGGLQTSRPYYEQQLVIANRNYLNEFSNIQLSGKPLGEDIFSEPTVLVPHKYKNDENSISEYIKQEYFRLMNYNQFYGIPGEEKTIDKFNVVYIDDDSTIKVNTENGFSDMANPVIIVDTGNFAGLYYLDSLNTRCLFFQMESREDFSSLLSEYDLEQLVTAGTLLTPYLMQLENVTFVLKTLTMFTIVFIVSLLFILYISNYVDIFVNRKRYAAKEILGFSHFRTLKNRYIFWGIEIIISGVLTAINYYFACLLRLYLLTTYSANCFIEFISQTLYMRLKRGHKYVIDYIKERQKEYGKNQVLFENLSLEIEKGEFVGLVGKSGAGKTTLLNIIGLITDISEGTITIDSHKNLSMNGKNAMILRRYTIGYLFQNYGLIEDESVLWNLKLALEYKKVKKRRKTETNQ
ncbi:MAG: ATP-binding cassette domain-containing protein [Acutalibacteraceae bacterium]